MIAVMNINNFESDRTSDVVEDRRRTKPRVSEDNVVVSEKIVVSRCDDVVVIHGGGHEGTSTILRSTVPEGFLISADLEKRAEESEQPRVFDANASDADKPLGYGFEIGDMVWGKVHSHPWWPGHIYSKAFASPWVRRSRDGHVLVAFFGDSTYGWFDPAELIPFVPNFAEKSVQTNSRTFVKAVKEAIDEESRRCGLGLACRCRNPFNFRPTNVQGCFAVDASQYEHGGVYSVNQIRKARGSFQPRDTIAFMKHLALAPPTSSEPGGIHFIKNKAIVLAYRRAVFQEFDETYAQAFGYQPVRPPRLLKTGCSVRIRQSGDEGPPAARRRRRQRGFGDDNVGEDSAMTKAL